ncbi:hypothetical protein D3C84_831860 [compost metagenome]
MCGIPRGTCFILIGSREYRRDQLCFTGTIAVAVQRASHVLAMTDYVRNATDDSISFAVLSTSDPIAFASMSDAIHHDSGIAIQDFATAGGLVIQANEITFIH